MRWPILVLLATLLVPAAALRADDAPAKGTILSASETASAMIAPDRLVATLRVESRGDAPTAQAHVNETMAKAVARARAVAGMTVETRSYATYEAPRPQAADPAPVTWIVRQDLVLRAADERMGALSGLTGSLQQDGLMLVGIEGDVSPTLRDSVQNRLIGEAIARLQATVETAAKALHLKAAGFKSLKIDKSDSMPRPMMAKALAAGPAIEPGRLSISVTAEGKALLIRPR